MNRRKVRIRFVAAGLLFSAISGLTLHAQQRQPAPNHVDFPKPAVAPTAGTWKYKEAAVTPADTRHGPLVSTFSTMIKDDGDVWTVTIAAEFSDGPVTDVSILEKGTLVLRKEAFKHFLHPDQPWKPVAIDLNFTGKRITGTMKYVDRADKPVAVDLTGPAFVNSTSSGVVIGCLPLAEGYSTTFRYFDIERLALNPQAPDKEKLLHLKVIGTERVTVPAGTFDSYQVELTSTDGSYKQTLWIAKDSRTPVKAKDVVVYGKKHVTIIIDTELVP